MSKARLTRILSHGWAIHVDNSLIGKLWWFEGRAPSAQIATSGYRYAIFRTRAIARERLSDVKSAYPMARVVKVIMDFKVCK